jgi:hypothetical protein
MLHTVVNLRIHLNFMSLKRPYVVAFFHFVDLPHWTELKTVWASVPIGRRKEVMKTCPSRGRTTMKSIAVVWIGLGMRSVTASDSPVGI